MDKSLALDAYYDLFDYFGTIEPIIIGIAQGLVIAGKRADKSRIRDDLENLNLDKYKHYLERMQKMQDDDLDILADISLMRFDCVLGNFKGAAEVSCYIKSELAEIQRRQAIGDLNKVISYCHSIIKNLEGKNPTKEDIEEHNIFTANNIKLFEIKDKNGKD